VNKNVFIVVCSLLFAITGAAQEETPKDQERDSVQQNLRDGGVVFEDQQLKKLKPINPLAPSKAAFYSAFLPGLGQIYNKRYWKVPIVYAALGTGIGVYINRNNLYNDFRDAFKSRQAGFITDEFYDRDLLPGEVTTNTTPDIDNDRLEDLQEARQNDRDLALVVTIILYALNIVDANVDAHLKQFNVDDTLSMNIEYSPYIELNPVTSNPNYGMALVIKF